MLARSLILICFIYLGLACDPECADYHRSCDNLNRMEWDDNAQAEHYRNKGIELSCQDDFFIERCPMTCNLCEACVETLLEQVEHLEAVVEALSNQGVNNNGGEETTVEQVAYNDETVPPIVSVPTRPPIIADTTTTTTTIGPQTTTTTTPIIIGDDTTTTPIREERTTTSSTPFVEVSTTTSATTATTGEESTTSTTTIGQNQQAVTATEAAVPDRGSVGDETTTTTIGINAQKKTEATEVTAPPRGRPVVTEEPEVEVNPKFAHITGGDQLDSTPGEDWDYTKMYDGGVSTDAWDDQCYVSGSDSQAWSEVYLDDFYTITSVSILNRADYGSEWATGMKVEICQGPGDFLCDLCDKFSGGDEGGVWLSVECKSMMGNTIRFYNKNNYLQICEIDFEAEEL